MSSRVKNFFTVFFIGITCSVLGMDNPMPQTSETLQVAAGASSAVASGQSSMNSSGSSSSSSSWLYSSGNSWTFNPVSLITGLVSSAATTVYNQTSQEAPFTKVGFPSTNSYAQMELTTCLELYKNIVTTQDRALSTEYIQRIFRRTEYLTRIFCMLSERHDFDEIILHCQKNHIPAMSIFLKDWYEKFLDQKLALYNQLNEERKNLHSSQDKQVPPLPATGSAHDVGSVQITIPTLAGVGEYLWSNTSSLYESAKNELLDVAAFQKLGWPYDDMKAQAELADTLARYEKVMQANTKEEQSKAVLFVLRRTEYLVRAFLAVPSRSDGFEFAQHLLKYHTKAMFPLLMQKFLHFTKNKHQGVCLRKNEISRPSRFEAIDNKMVFEFGTLTNKKPEEIKKSLEDTHCILLQQIHQTKGCVVTVENRPEMLTHEGDFLVTNMPNIKLGVLTADCLPIIFNDTKNNAVGIAHAGWRGSVKGISSAVLTSMQGNYTTKPEDLSVIFGPCIHNCCYKVGQELISGAKQHAFGEKTIITRGQDTFFDLLAFNKAFLISLGVKEASIDATNSVCTSCNKQYHSHRREGDTAGRQLSIVWIKQ